MHSCIYVFTGLKSWNNYLTDLLIFLKNIYVSFNWKQKKEKGNTEIVVLFNDIFDLI